MNIKDNSHPTEGHVEKAENPHLILALISDACHVILVEFYF